jgi:protein-disulfide isomerase
MRQLDRSLIEGASNLGLRVWVADRSGWQQMIPDQSLNFNVALPQNSTFEAESSTAILAELRLLRDRVTQLERKGGDPKPPPDSETASIVSLRLARGLEGEKVLGAARAPLVLLEYTDYQCPFCQRFYQTTFSQLKSNYIDTGRIRFVSRNLPLPGHQQSMPAALAAVCAGAQEKYWEMRNEIFRSSEPLAASAFQKWAGDLGLNLPRFESCLANPDSARPFPQQIADAAAVGITGTPTFILGRVDDEGILRGELLVGAKPYAEFQQRIEAMLSETK